MEKGRIRKFHYTCEQCKKDVDFRIAEYSVEIEITGDKCRYCGHANNFTGEKSKNLHEEGR